MILRLHRRWMALPALIWAGLCFYVTLYILQQPHSTETLIVVSLTGTGYAVSLLLSWISFGRWAAISLAVMGMIMLVLPVIAIPYGWFLAYGGWFAAVLTVLDRVDKTYENERLVEQVNTEKNLEEKNRLIQDLIRRRANVQALRGKYRAHVSLKAVADDFSGTLDLTKLAALIIEKTSGVIPKAEVVLVYHVNLDTSQLSLMASKGKETDKKVMSKLGDLFDHWVLKHRQPLLITDIKSDYRFDSANPDIDPSIKCLMAAPMINEGRIIGVLRVNAYHEDEFDTDDLRVLSILAVLASSAMTNALLFRKTQELAISDSLTGLYVQRYFRERFEEEHKRALISNSPFSVLMCDIDFFKQCNDQYGHATGDLVLKAVSARLREGVGDAGIVARYGGEEFAIILRNADKDAAHKLAETLRCGVETLRVPTRGIELSVTLSIGLATFSEDAMDTEALLEKADRALYQAKRKGRNTVCTAVQD